MGCQASFESNDAKCMSIFGSLSFAKCICDCLAVKKGAENEEEQIKSVVEEVKGMSRENIESIIETALRKVMTPPSTLRHISIAQTVEDDGKMPPLPESPDTAEKRQLDIVMQNLTAAGLA